MGQLKYLFLGLRNKEFGTLEPASLGIERFYLYLFQKWQPINY